MDSKLIETVTSLFSQIMEVPHEKLDLDARLDDAYGVTSVNRMRLVSEVEIALDIEVPEKEIQEVRTLREVIALCEKYALPEARAASGGR